jgi:signal transduction histidine kinase
VRSGGARAWIAVVDDGPGIKAEELARAGERFFRGSDVRQPGTGLGLSIVKSIVERLGGELLLAPGPNSRGLRATIALPAFDLGRQSGGGESRAS